MQNNERRRPRRGRGRRRRRKKKKEPCLVYCVPGMDRQYTLCVLVPAHQYRTYVNNYHQHAHHHRFQQHQRQQYPEQQRSSCKQPYQQEQIYENVVSQYRMRMCYHNDYENDEQIQRFYWEQCYRRDDTDATAYYYCEYVRITGVLCFARPFSAPFK